jgi:NAD(P)-dependent dehydrogenase (short-subunit alcohol dehydrogenase family)
MEKNMPDQELRDKTAVVTGGGRGIGAAIATRLALMGASTIVCGRTKTIIDRSAEQIRKAGGKAEAIACDVSDWNSVAAFAQQVQQKFGRLDILVNNAGIGGFNSPLQALPIETWDAILNTNLRGVFYTIRAFAPMLIASGGGDIVNISSLAGKNALPNGAAYAASKWGLNGLSYSVAEELRQHKIRVSVVCPGSTHTELSPHDGKSPDKMLHAEDIAHAVAMLVTQRPNAFVSEVLIRPTQKP